MSSLASATGTRPDIALYYSGWGEPFQLTFAREAAQHGAVPLIQIEPTASAWPPSPTAATSRT